MNGTSSQAAAAATPSGSRVSFSAFLMEPTAPTPSPSSASPPAPSLPPLRGPLPLPTPVKVITPNGSTAPAARGSGGSSDSRSRSSSSNSNPGGKTRATEDDIPVLEMRNSGVHSDVDNDVEILGDEEEEDEGEDDQDGNGAVVGVYDFEEDDFVPVLQTAEDAARTFSRVAGGQVGGKKFSWRESTRRVARRTRPHSARDVAVPDPEMLLRMSTRSSSDFSSTYRSSNSVGSRKSSLRLDRQLVRSGWLFKQANVM